MKRALVIGIDHYDDGGDLDGCVNDAHAVRDILVRNGDQSLNFEVKLIVSTPDTGVSTRDIRDAVKKLFEGDPEVALFYFAGHGYAEDGSGYVCGSDAVDGDDGYSFHSLMEKAQASKARNKVIVLDSCFSGAAGNRSGETKVAEISDGLTVLTASTDEQAAEEQERRGVFTTLFVDALDGAAADLMGHITPGAVYAHVDQSLGSWGQRPVFKTNIKRYVSLRSVKPPLDPDELRQLATFFPSPEHVFPLDPSYEPEHNAEQQADESIPPPDPDHVKVFRILQNYFRVNLVRPVAAPYMYHAAMETKACKLTALGQHYQRLVAKELI